MAGYTLKMAVAELAKIDAKLETMMTEKRHWINGEPDREVRQLRRRWNVICRSFDLDYDLAQDMIAGVVKVK